MRARGASIGTFHLAQQEHSDSCTEGSHTQSPCSATENSRRTKELPARLQFNRIVRFVRFQLSFPFKLIMGISVQLIVSPKEADINTNQYKNDLPCIGACL
jgi:hypothetical protein